MWARLFVHREMSSTWTSIEFVADEAVGDAARLVLSTCGGGSPDVVAPDEQPLFQGRTIARRPSRRRRSSSPAGDPVGTLGRCSTVCVKSARMRMFMLGDAVCPSSGQSDSSATLLWLPSAPRRYLAADLRDRLAGRCRTVAVTPSPAVEGEVLGVELHLRPARCGGFEQDRLEGVWAGRTCSKGLASS